MQASENKHTFVVCAYKESGYLEECVQSLLRQTAASRILISTSTPNDWIGNVAAKYKLPLRVRQGEAGIAQDWNFAYSQASSDYVTLAHQDDIYATDYTARMLSAMEAAEAPLIFCSNYYEIRNGRKVTGNRLLNIKRLLIAPLRIKKWQHLTLARRWCLAFGNSICCPSVTFAARNLPAEIFSVQFRSNVDWQAWERLSKMRGSFCYDSAMLVGHRIHDASETSRVIGDGRRRGEDLAMFQKFWCMPAARLLTKYYASSEKSNVERKI